MRNIRDVIVARVTFTPTAVCEYTNSGPLSVHKFVSWLQGRMKNFEKGV